MLRNRKRVCLYLFRNILIVEKVILPIPGSFKTQLLANVVKVFTMPSWYERNLIPVLYLQFSPAKFIDACVCNRQRFTREDWGL